MVKVQARKPVACPNRRNLDLDVTKPCFFARCGSPAVSHLLEKPLENWTRAAARTPPTHAGGRSRFGSGRRAAGDQLSSSEQQPISAATYFFPLSSSGGGFAGAYCVRALSVGLRQAAADALALVADQNVMLHPMLAEVSGSSIHCGGSAGAPPSFATPSRTSTWRRRPCASRPGPSFPRPP